MPGTKVSIQSSHIFVTDAENDWTLEIQDENHRLVKARFPSFNSYAVLIDGEPSVDSGTIRQVFSLSPYNNYDCVLWNARDGHLIVDSIVVRNSLLDGDVVHHISVIPRTA